MSRAERRAKERAVKKARVKVMNKPSVVKARAEILKLLAAFFEKEPDKIHAWLSSPNMNLGGISPAKMIATGRHEKLATFVKTQMQEGGFDVEAILGAKETPTPQKESTFDPEEDDGVLRRRAFEDAD